MLISRRVFSPEWRIPGNKVDRTWGFYGHLPKYWSCRKHDWTFQPRSSADTDDFVAHMQRVYDEQREAHSRCWFPWHRSYHGYLCFVFPRRGRLMWNYWGKSPNPNHGRFVWQPDYLRKYRRRSAIWGE